MIQKMPLIDLDMIVMILEINTAQEIMTEVISLDVTVVEKESIYCVMINRESKYGRARNTRYSIVVKNVSSKISWQVFFSSLFAFIWLVLFGLRIFLTSVTMHGSLLKLLYLDFYFN